ncbi:DEAD/DEAH box helicase family protein [Lysobacter ciconiae]|uniref:DEAD/DEAH box helicase family protein n=1 Tax=Novilysobacter ciconiae TaxID=2781022 RepID=A0A7S6UH87_9GAMM|nr:helicase-related protein [Lysobacter ciconiae]QOW20221.1 DEAD/DEAH box helicase family protein [Lysobacter ciconiae]
MGEYLIPANGAWVVAKATSEKTPGVVMASHSSERGVSLTVNWLGKSQRDVVPLRDLECGFKPGYEVLHVPASSFETSLGYGVVHSIRQLGGRTQVLVDFHEDGARIWVPWERLRFIKGARFRFRTGDQGGPDAAERLRLRNLAHALVLWNENTGSLSHFDIDPLPHQIHLVHHILSSGNLNWLIADDVGLGKTIEAGLLIAALRQRNVARRVLLVVPAGLTRQWQEDLKYKFGLDDFLIYGSDFNISDTTHWKLYDRVIASLDKVKVDDHLARLKEAEPWDLIIFDEAHRLTRRQYGMKYQKSDRFELAEALRQRTRNVLMLTATPHQGNQSQFQALLELLRPELKAQFSLLGIDSSVLSKMVFRNRKSDVTDIDGNFVFHGQTSRMVQVDSSPELVELEAQLRSYLKLGYSAAEHLGKGRGGAIGFVMTVYRKLAASSIRTLQLALMRRLVRLTSQAALAATLDDGFMEERYSGEYEETKVAAQETREEFFVGETERLKTLIEVCRAAGEDDQKMQAFLERVIAPITRENPDERVLIFTEYRGTQDYIVEQLQQQYGASKVDVINGGMNVEERRAAIARFEGDGQFLVSTEAGGEGLNLHRRCHLLVNYDLPWNPMRLAQRIGRLYRYGQEHHVVAFNLQGVNSADDLVVSNMYARLDQVAADMAGVDQTSSENLVSDIVGELASLLDVEEILEQASRAGVQRTQENIEDAMRRARETSELQRKLFQHAVSYDADEMRSGFRVGALHLQAFVLGMVRLLGGNVGESRRFPGAAWLLDVPAAAGLPRLGRDGRITFDRELRAESTPVELLDLDHPFVAALMERARSYDFQGLTAAAELPGFSHVVTAMLRWQDERGLRLRQEFHAIAVDRQGALHANPQQVADWLLTPIHTVPCEIDRAVTNGIHTGVESFIDAQLARRSNANLHPENREWLSAAWCSEPTLPTV